MSTSFKEIKQNNITATDFGNSININRVVKTFLSNSNNKKKLIGLNTELVQKTSKLNKTALLELCDGNHCLIVQLPRNEEEEEVKFPVSLFNFLNLPDYTFVGIDINKIILKLESEFGLTCKNVVEVGSSTWNLSSRTGHQKYMITDIVSCRKPKNAVFDEWDNVVLNNDQIKLAAWNAQFAFLIADNLLDVY